MNRKIGWFTTEVCLKHNVLEATILQRNGNDPNNEYYFYLLKDGKVCEKTVNWGGY